MTSMQAVQTAGATAAPTTVAFGGQGPAKTTETNPARVAQYRAG